jgi:hypothetical protein
MQAVTAVTVLAVLSLLFPPLSLLSSAGVALITLRKGWTGGSSVFLLSGIAIAVLGGLLFGGYLFMLGYGLVLWIPVWLISIVLRESGRIELTVEAAALLGVVVVLTVYAAVSDPAGLWQSRVDQILEPLIEQAAADFDAALLMERIGRISHYMTGIMVCGTLVSVLLGLFLGRWWQAALFNPGGFGREFLALRPHGWIAWGSVGMVVAAMFAGGGVSEVAWNMVLPMFVLFTMVGVAVLHTAIAYSKAKRVLLILMYFTMLFIPHVLLLIAVVGLTDTWIDWRARVSAG